MTNARCPKNEEHKEFIATAHVTQSWKVDSQGEFIEVLEDCMEVTHSPKKDDIWTCAICGTEAIL